MKGERESTRKQEESLLPIKLSDLLCCMYGIHNCINLDMNYI